MSLPQPTSSGLTLLPVDCFARIARQPGSVWLDSWLSWGGGGNHSLLAANPVGQLVLNGDRGNITTLDGENIDCARRGIFDELERIRTGHHRCAIGYLTYEAALPWLGLQPGRNSKLLPQCHFQVYDRVVWYDHALGEFSDPDLAIQLLETVDSHAEPVRLGSMEREPMIPCTTKEAYLNKTNRVKHHIREGDIYQANFTCRFDVPSLIDPFVAYLRLRRLNPAPYGAYFNFGQYQLLSSSPERMFLWDGNDITSSPIKGTIQRGDDSKTTRMNLNRLLNSEKDRAELLMIVDLVRNDLGRIAQTGSVTVDRLYRPEVYSSLIHLVADVSARVRPGTTLEEVLAALLPGGSITGAPKRRAVEILNELEETERSAYTGSIGYVGNGRAEFNIGIRTIMHKAGWYHIHAGGGIVADSDPEAEYEEMLLKARNLLKAVGAL